MYSVLNWLYVEQGIILERGVMVSVPLTLLCDKGCERKIREGENFLKLTTKYGHEEKEFDVNCFRISSTGNDSISAAHKIIYTLQSYDTPTNYASLDNQGTDACGGGTREDLGKIGGRK